ncbi:hypothetical protein D3C74_358110 [compost metagenome]
MHIGRNRLQIHLNLLVVPVSLACQVIPGMDNGAVRILLVVETDQVQLVGQLSIFAQEQCRCIAVDVGLLLDTEESACRLSRVPAKSYNDIGQSGVSLC